MDEPLCKECLSDAVLSVPPCPICGFPIRAEKPYCPSCLGKINFAGGTVYSCFRYKGTIRKLLLSIKFKYNIRSAATFHNILKLPEDFNLNIYDAIVPVPSHFSRRFKRFYHPAEVAAKFLSSISGKPLLKALVRNKRTVFQYKLKARDRKQNVIDAFTVYYDINMLNILLVDDIFTSGSTLNECARILKSAGASLVDCFVIALD